MSDNEDGADDEQVRTGPLLKQRRGRQPSEAREEFLGPEENDWDQTTWTCKHCNKSWKWGKSGAGSRMEAHITGDCSKLKGVTVHACRKCPDEVRARVSGKKATSSTRQADSASEGPMNMFLQVMPAQAQGPNASESPGPEGSTLRGQWGAMPLFQVASAESPMMFPSTEPPAGTPTAAETDAKMQRKVDKVNEKCAQFFFECAIAFNVIDHPAFEEFCGVLGYEPPGRKW